MMNQRQALFYSALIAILTPQAAWGQVFSSDLGLSNEFDFSSQDSNIPVSTPPTFPDSSLPTGDSKFSLSDTFTIPDTPSPSDSNPDDSQAKPNFLKDLFLGASPNRPIHPSTEKVFKALDYASKGLQTYKGLNKIHQAIKGKSPDRILGGVRNILAVYGIVDPLAAITATTAIQTAGELATIQNDRIIKSAMKFDPKTPRDWYDKGRNRDAIASMAAATGPDIVLGEEGQKQLKADTENSIASMEALQTVIADAAQSSQTVRELEQASQQETQRSAAIAAETPKRKSTQQSVKDGVQVQQATNTLTAISATTLAEINDNSVRQLGGTASIVGSQSTTNTKLESIQLMTAMNGRQLGNINSGIDRSHYYQVGKDLEELDHRRSSMSTLIVPTRSGSDTSQSTSTAETP